MKLVIEVDDDEIRRVLAPLLESASPPATTQSHLLTVNDVAQQLRISRSKAYELLSRGEINSITVGRRRRVSAPALQDYVARLTRDSSGLIEQRAVAVDLAFTAPVAAPRRVSGSTGKPSAEATQEINLDPSEDTSTSPRLSDEEWANVFTHMADSGWPEDVVDQMRLDHKNRIRRTYALSISASGRYLGLTRSGVEKLVAAGKLRSFKIARPGQDQKSERRIPAKDILALR